MCKNVLVTGGTGFIGSHLVEELLRQGRKVRALALPKPFAPIELENLTLIKNKGAEIVYGDLRDIESLKLAVKGTDSIFHLGGISRPMRILKQEYYDNSVFGTQNILQVAKENNIKKFVHVSSVSVLGVSPDGHPLKEDEFQEEDSHYSVSKLGGEKKVLEYYRKYNFPVVVIRPCLIYGPRCLVRLIMFKFVKFGLFPLFNHGKAHMEFCYVNNVVQALLLAEKNDDVIGEVFNITDGQSYEIRTVLNTIAKELCTRPPFISLPVFIGTLAGYFAEIVSAIVGVYPPFSSTAAEWMSKDRNVYDCNKAKEILGYEPRISLDEGMKRSVEWYKKRGIL